MRWATLCLLLTGCNSSGGTQVLMSFERASFYTAPFPSDDLLRADGHVDVSRVPNPNHVQLIDQGLALIAADAHGFALSSTILLPLTGPLDATKLPDLAGSVAATSPVFLVGVTDGAPDFLHRYPVQIAFQPDGGPFGAPNLLSLLPLQGIPLRPHQTYAAVVLTTTRDASGKSLAPAPALADLLAGRAPAGLAGAALASYQQAIAALAKSGVAGKQLAGLAVFTTDDPTAELTRFRDDALTRPLPAPLSPLVRTDTFDDYCVYSSTILMPDYQGGDPPFTMTGGGWLPTVQRQEEANLIVTVPRATMPAAGFPITVFIRAGGGGDRPLVDRGPQAVTDGPPIAPGTGPALHFARAGFAGLSFDGPLGGKRNTTGGDEQFLIFNVMNAAALRDNIRQSALELSLIERVLEQLSFDASDCPGVGATPVRFDATHVALMGHSIGATIAPLVLALEPRYGAAILSGAGGSWIENVMYKKKPLYIRPLAEILLDYDMDQRDLTENDAALMLVQWAAEPADPPVYDRAVGPTHVLMLQGIVDHYILPQIANTTSLSLDLDLAGDELDSSAPELATQTPLGAVLPWSGGQSIAFPVSGNRQVGARTVTAIVVQHPADTIEDGHEVAFQTDPPKHEYRCFLTTWLAGVPKVPHGQAAGDPCP